MTYIIHSFIHFWLAPLASNVDISLQSGRFWAMSIASFSEKLLDFRSSSIYYEGVLMVFYSSPRGNLLRSFWHLFHLAFTQCEGMTQMTDTGEVNRLWTEECFDRTNLAISWIANFACDTTKTKQSQDSARSSHEYAKKPEQWPDFSSHLVDTRT